MNLAFWISNQRQRYGKGLLTSEEIAALESISDWTWEVQNSAWDNQYQRLVNFLEEHNGEYPTRKEFKWTDTQRTHYRNRKISKDKIDLLEALPGWEWEPRSNMWDRQYKTMVKFLEENGMFPTHTSAIGQWGHGQRSDYRNERLSEERIALLESLPDWSWEPYDSAWNNQYRKLVKFLEKNRKYPIQRGTTEGVWINTQRTRKEKLSKDKIDLLEALPGWEWEPKKESWEIQYQILVVFLEENYRHPTQEEFTWCNKQRTSYKNGVLSKERIALLESLPGWEWEPQNSAWDKQYQILLRFLNENYRYPTRGESAGKKESAWVNKQRMAYKNGKLSKERVELLEALPKWLWHVR